MTPPHDKDADKLDWLLDQLALHYQRQVPPPSAPERFKAGFQDVHRQLTQEDRDKLVATEPGRQPGGVTQDP